MTEICRTNNLWKGYFSIGSKQSLKWFSFPVWYNYKKCTLSCICSLCEVGKEQWTEYWSWHMRETNLVTSQHKSILRRGKEQICYHSFVFQFKFSSRGIYFSSTAFFSNFENYIFLNKYNHTINMWAFRTLPFPTMINCLLNRKLTL